MTHTKKINESEKITITLLADTVNIDRSTLSNYLSGNRKMPYDVALSLAKITGINKDLFLEVSYQKQDPYKLKKKLGLVGLESEIKLNCKLIRDQFNLYLDNLRLAL